MLPALVFVTECILRCAFGYVLDNGLSPCLVNSVLLCKLRLAEEDMYRSAPVEPKNDHMFQDPVYASNGDVHHYKHSLTLKACKRSIDIVAALCFFALFGWLYLLLWFGVLITSGGPAMYSQPRYGRGGRLFKFYKFRSMVKDADHVLEQHLKNDLAAKEQWDSFQKLEKDPRITKFGNLIRKTSLDELPQFWNVLVGDMSLIGPRPCMVGQKDLYGDYWSSYCMVRPGITGLWQVSGRNQLDYKSRVVLDVKYVRNLSLIGDFLIAIRTIYVVATGHGSR